MPLLDSIETARHEVLKKVLKLAKTLKFQEEDKDVKRNREYVRSGGSTLLSARVSQKSC
ncbi:MAG: hypothetical protein WA667_04625 [Candidatus Nitrosopolaris sp.]